MTHQMLFVYGSLRRGKPWHLLLAGSTYLGRAILHDHTIVQRGWYPAAIKAPGCTVRGELYLAPTRLLARLDEFEDVPHEYVRRRLSVLSENMGQVQAWTYVAAWRGPVARSCRRSPSRHGKARTMHFTVSGTYYAR